MTATEELSARITNYLSSGGLFNPELMEADKVRALLIDCRDFLDQRPQESVLTDWERKEIDRQYAQRCAEVALPIRVNIICEIVQV